MKEGVHRSRIPMSQNYSPKLHDVDLVVYSMSRSGKLLHLFRFDGTSTGTWSDKFYEVTKFYRFIECKLVGICDVSFHP